MPVRALCQRFFQKALAPLHVYRQRALIDSASAVINGASLSLTSIGRHLSGNACVKHKIKRVDRLLGNTHLHDEVFLVFQSITKHLVRNMPRIFILIDWSSYHSESFQLLRASLACDGRSLPLMSCVVPKSQQGNAEVHERFISALANSISPDTEVTVVTDAGFHGSWFRIIRQQGWTFICRVLGNHHYRTEDEWEKVADVGKKACSKPLYLGQGYLGRTPGTHHSGHFYLYKQKAKGRKTKRSKGRVLRVTLEKKGRASNRAPWLIFTNSTQYSPRQIMKIYSRRMQIEQISAMRKVIAMVLHCGMGRATPRDDLPY